MNELKSFNGERLRTARKLKGLEIGDLAKELDVKRQTISMYETGKISAPEFSKVQKMSQILGFPIDFFLSDDLDSVKFSKSVYFRSLLTTGKKYRSEQELKISIVSTIYAYLSEYINFQKPNLPEIDIEDDIEDIALALRKCWNLGVGPINNLIFQSEQNGIIVTSFDTSTNDIDAFSQKVTFSNEDHYIIALSQNKNTAARLHFDVAHELGHILLHDWNDDIDSLSPEEFREREQEANDFASAFLLPKESFYNDIAAFADKLDYYIELKRKWKVSVAAMIRRSKNLNLITYDKYQSLMRAMQKRGIRKFEPYDDVLITAKPSIFQTAIDMLINGEVLTANDIVKELSDEYNLSLYPEYIETLLGLTRGTLKIDTTLPFHFLELKQSPPQH